MTSKPLEEYYYVGSNRCNCHPETCCCNDFAVFYPNGDKHSTHFDLETAVAVAKGLNVDLLINEDW